ncbi:DEAD-box type RNA helicase [Coemansia sp. RSA 1933]|nr:DEAD-box type RNA helicase [Coemansia sp. RSA 1933]
MKAHVLDRSQAEAVVSGVKRETGFTLIQGGPGTLFGENVKDVIKINIARRFQGDERDVIILFCVKAGEGDAELPQYMVNMGIAFTRARKSLFVLGNIKRLTANPLWRAFIDDTKNRGLL